MLKNLIKYIVLFCLIISCKSKNKVDLSQEKNKGITTNYLSIALYKNSKIPLGMEIDSNTNLAIHKQVYECLFFEDSKTKRAKPLLISSYRSDASKTNWVFTLKDDIYFHDDACFEKGKGRKLTAYDVEFCFKELLNYKVPNTNYSLKDSLIAVEIKVPTDSLIAKTDSLKKDSTKKIIYKLLIDRGLPFYSVRALNDRQFILELANPDADLPKKLCDARYAIYAKEVKTYYYAATYPVAIGTGPFYLDQYSDKECLLFKNINYHQNQKEQNIPSIDAIRFIFVNSEKKSLSLFQKGDIDIHYFGKKDSIKYYVKEDIKSLGKEEIDYWNFKKVNIDKRKFILPYN
jgi:ABC-type transport system substrate-binding protein